MSGYLNTSPGCNVYTIVRHVSSSGMNRSISLFVAHKGEVVCLDWAAARLLGGFDQKHGGIKTDVVGMDATFAVVYELAQVLFGGGEGKALTRIQL